MLTHEDPEVATIVALLEAQRDYAMGHAAKLAKENAELIAKISGLEASKPA
jgi:hypothetical protein